LQRGTARCQVRARAHARTGRFSRQRAIPGVATEGSEIFYFEHYKIRLPLRFGASSESAHTLLYHATPHQGALGLGRHSPLWSRWRSYVLSEDELWLGGSPAESNSGKQFSDEMPLDAPLDIVVHAALPAVVSAASAASNAKDGIHMHAQAKTQRNAGDDLGSMANETRGGAALPLAPTTVAAAHDGLAGSGAGFASNFHARLAALVAQGDSVLYTKPLRMRISLETYDSALPDPFFLAPAATLSLSMAPSRGTRTATSTATGGGGSGSGIDDGTVHFRLEPPVYASRHGQSGFVYNALRRVPNASVATLGQSALRHHVLYVHGRGSAVRIAPSIGASQRAAAPVNLVMAAGVLLSGIAFLLLSMDAAASTNAPSVATCSARRLPSGMTLLRIYAHLCAVLIFFVNVLGLETRRMLEHYAHVNATVLLVYVGVSALGGAALAFTPLEPAPLLIAACAPSAWLALVARHDSSAVGGGIAGTLVLLLVSGTAAAALAMHALDVVLLRSRRLCNRWLRCRQCRKDHFGLEVVFSVVAAVTAQLAFVAFNAHEVVHIEAREHRLFSWGGALLLWAAAVAAPAMFLFAAKEIAAANATVAAQTDAKTNKAALINTPG